MLTPNEVEETGVWICCSNISSKHYNIPTSVRYM